ncbi:short-chain dehydrogenase/reductase SDR [Parafrankia sp. EAN1pec]|uniref:SDR family oxidoreductase n=1 Tax=Parafrankia sp. (strain EAN1pec) TaxID=298653 RepID=UPI0000540FCB|nr:short-chain dehydrogenase/reductase SDR [Frankia sp. EAN1pec]
MTSVGIVTGAGRGMGAACAAQLADQVDVLLLVDLNEELMTETATALTGAGRRATVELFSLDIADAGGVARLAARVSELGTLRSVAHVAGISPTMADWRRVLDVDLVGSARLTDTLLPLATAGTAIVCFASLAPLLTAATVDPVLDAVLADPLAADFLDRLRAAAGPAIEDSGAAYTLSDAASFVNGIDILVAGGVRAALLGTPGR